jgi:phospholipid transport system substrate-binding protein
MYRFLKHFILVLATAWVSTTVFAADIAPDVLAKNVTNDVVRIVRQDKDIANGDAAKINALVEQRILPLFDFKHMTQLAVGKHWSSATPEQQETLTNEYRSMLVRTYSSALSVAVNSEIKFKPSRIGDNRATVSMEVMKSGTTPLDIEYILEKQDAGWKVYDVKVEGASLITSNRSSFNSEVRKGGIDGLIATLARHNKKP